MTASINPNGAVSGKLKNGDSYTSQIPTVLNDPSLAAVLRTHHVSVTGVRSSSSLVEVLVLSPLPVFRRPFQYRSLRSTRRQLAGGIMGIGASKAKVYDEQRPSTRFSDIAGYEGARREVSEVVDFLKHPDRYAKAGAIGSAAC